MMASRSSPVPARHLYEDKASIEDLIAVLKKGLHFGPIRAAIRTAFLNALRRVIYSKSNKHQRQGSTSSAWLAPSQELMKSCD